MSNTVHSNNAIISAAGLFLAVMFSFNVAFGNAVMSVVSFGVPLNQLLIAFFLLLLASTDLIKIPIGFTILLYIWIFLNLFIWMPIGFLNHGIIAGRDATQVLDAMVIFLAFSVFYRMDGFSIVKAFEKVFLLALSLEFLDRVILFQFEDITLVAASSLVEVNLFGGTIGSGVIVTASFWFGIIMKDSLRVSSFRLLTTVSIILVLLLQNRFLYVSMILTTMAYLVICRPNFLNKSLLKKIFFVIIALILFETFVGSIIGSILSLMGESEYILSERLFKYGISSFSLTGILELLQTGFGIENEEYSGAAGGLFLRLEWWVTLFTKMFADTSTLLFGMGYGIPLTDGIAITAIREPHNSFISVFCRNGLILFLIWITFHILVVWKSFRALKRVYKDTFEYKLLLVSLLTIISSYICGLVEPAFELPPVSIPTYIFIGLSLVMLNRIKRFKKEL